MKQDVPACLMSYLSASIQPEFILPCISPHFFLVTNYYKENQQILISCILSVTVLTLISSIVSTFISTGYPREKLEFLRHYSVFNLVACELMKM